MNHEPINNFPTAKLSELPEDFVSDTVVSLRQLYDLGKPKTDAEFDDRINYYFDFCRERGMRPGIETLALALGVNRTTLFRWSHGEGCSQVRQDAVLRAKALISAFLELSMQSGKVSPPIGIFLAKNWLNYKDTVSIEETIADTVQGQRPRLTAEEIMQRHRGAQLPEKPNFDEFE